MKKGICFMMAAALCAVLLTACGNDSRQSDNANAQDQSGSSNTVESSRAENQDNGVITGTEEPLETTNAADSGQVAESTENGQAVSQILSERNNMASESAAQIGNVTAGTEYEEDFLIDNVLIFNDTGEYADVEELHYHIYVPDSYDGSRPYALYITLPGYGAYYFQGVAVNLKMEHFAKEARKYNEEMIIVAPQPNDWGETSKRQTIGLTEYMLAAYNIDPDMVYISGYSGGGETLSLAVSEKPELYTAALHVSSKWDGDLDKVAEEGIPVYFAIGENDEYYGSESARNAYGELVTLYERAGVSREAIDNLAVLDVKDRSYFSDRGMSNQHGGGGLFAEDKAIMGWLFGVHDI